MDNNVVQSQSAQDSETKGNGVSINNALTNDLKDGVETSNSSLSIFGFKIPVPKYGYTYELAKLEANLIRNTFDSEAPRIFGKENDKNSGYDSRVISGAGAAFLYVSSSYLVPAALILDVARVAIESNVLSRGGDKKTN